MLFVLVALPMFLVAACLVARMWLWDEGLLRVLSLAGLLTLTDWLRGHIFTGFPWNLWGNALAAALPWAQMASLVGVYGLSLFVLLVAMIPAQLVDGHDSQQRDSSWHAVLRRDMSLARWIAPVVLIVIAAASWIWGAQRMQPLPVVDREGVVIRLVQPNFDQQDKSRRERFNAMADILLRLSFFPDDADRTQPPRLIIWPEVALPIYLEEEPRLLAHLAALLPEGSKLMAGSLRREQRDGIQRSYNSLLVIDDDGILEGYYDKQHLVPFGEYLPYGEWLRGLGFEALARRSDFASGTGSRILSLGRLPDVGALICYEVIFSGDLLQEERPAWLVNISNDAWFGDSIGPWQHLDQAVLRAIEEGLPVLRATNTGVSALIDPYGRIRAMLGVNQRGTLDVRLPEPLEPTLFSRRGDLPALLASILLIAAGCARIPYRRKSWQV